MTPNNGYCTLAAFKASKMPNAGTDAADDGVIESIIAAASRTIDSLTGHEFYPSIEEREFDTPEEDELDVHGDLCEVLTLTNGDATAIASTDYKLWPYNTYPKAIIQLLPLSTIYFNQGTTNWKMAAIAVNGIWADHPDYDRAWAVGTTLGAAVTTTSATSWTVTASTNFASGNVARVDNELVLVTATGTGTLTVTRGWNGSTAATHLNGAAITIWVYPPDIEQACIAIARAEYQRRFGENEGEESAIMPSGMVISTGGIPKTAMAVIKSYQRQVY